jgi:hypothetical protein
MLLRRDVHLMIANDFDRAYEMMSPSVVLRPENKPRFSRSNSR